MGSRPPTPHTGTNYREHVGSSERVKRDNLDVRKIWFKAEGREFINELEQGTASLTDEEFARLKRMIVERRGRDAAQVAIAPIDTAELCSPRSRCSEISFDARVYMERNDEGRINPERGQLESPSAGTGLETP